MPFEGVREQQRDEMRVAGEVHAEHLVGLAFVPARARVDAHGGGQRGGVVRHGRPDDQPAYAAGVRHIREVRADPEAGAGLVDGAQPVEIGAAEAVPGGRQGGDPAVRRNVDRQQLVRLVGRGPRPEDLARGPRQPPDDGLGGGLGNRLRGGLGNGLGGGLANRFADRGLLLGPLLAHRASSPAVLEAGGATSPLRSAAAEGRAPPCR